MKRTSDAMKIVAVLALTMCLALLNCAPFENEYLQDLKIIGLNGEEISARAFLEGTEPKGFLQAAGAAYKPSFNEDPGIPAQCWIETGYGTQNACQYCHTNGVYALGLGNNLPQKQPIEVWQREAGMDWQILESPVHFKSDAIGHPTNHVGTHLRADRSWLRWG